MLLLWEGRLTVSFLITTSQRFFFFFLWLVAWVRDLASCSHFTRTQRLFNLVLLRNPLFTELELFGGRTWLGLIFFFIIFFSQFVDLIQNFRLYLKVLILIYESPTHVTIRALWHLVVRILFSLKDWRYIGTCSLSIFARSPIHLHPQMSRPSAWKLWCDIGGIFMILLSYVTLLWLDFIFWCLFFIFLVKCLFLV